MAHFEEAASLQGVYHVRTVCAWREPLADALHEVYLRYSPRVFEAFALNLNYSEL